MSALAPAPRFPTFKFATPGTSITGRVAYPPKDSQVRIFGSNELATWPDGNPKMQTQVVLATDAGEFAIYVKDRMAKAVRDAVASSGARDVEVGGTLTVRFTEFKQGKGAQPAKLYEASYTPPAVLPAGDPADYDEPPF